MNDNYENIIPITIISQKKTTLSLGASKEHIANNNDIIYVLEGSITYVINGKHHFLPKGSIAYVPRGSLKYAYTMANESFCLYSFLFIYKYLDGINFRLPFPIVLPVKTDAKLLNLMSQLYEVNVEKNERHLLKSRALLMLIIDRLFELSKNSPQRSCNKHIRIAKEYILTHYSEHISLDDLAKLTGLHKVYLSKIFKETMSCNINYYINKIRINRAAELLLTGEYLVQEVAFECGFNDRLYFSKVFKNHMGVSPSTYISP